MVKSKDKRIAIGLRLRPDTHAQVIKQAKRYIPELSAQQWIETAIAEKLSREGEGKGR